MKDRVVFIVPARGGSKGIPRKNIVEVLGVPLVGWTIEVCKKCSFYSDNIYVTSDSEEILDYCSKAGARVIRRPEEISGDLSTSESAISHAIEEIEKERDFDLVVFLQPTSPLRHPGDLEDSINKFYEEGLDSLFTSCLMEDFFYWKKSGSNFLSVNYDYKNRKRRQEIEETFLENGSFYIFKKSGFILSRNRLFGKIGTFVMESYKKYEVDKKEDLELVEFYLNKIKKQEIGESSLS